MSDSVFVPRRPAAAAFVFQALLTAGGNLDQVCESCHMTFWYPNQVIPPLH